MNGEVVTELGTKILRADEVKFKDQPVSLEKKVYVLLNKPKDYVTTSDDPQQRKTVMDLVKGICPERIYSRTPRPQYYGCVAAYQRWRPCKQAYSP